MATHHTTEADEVLADVLEPGQDIVVGQGAGTPRMLLAALGNHLDRLRGSRILVGLLSDPLPELPGARIRTFFPSGPLGDVDEFRRRGVAYERLSLYDLASRFWTGEFTADVLLGQGTPEQGGLHSLGVSVDYAAAAASRAGTVVLEVGDTVPWTGSGSTIPADSVRVVIGTSGPAPEVREPNARDRVMAEHAVGWIPDGATIQLGMGPWATAVARLLGDRRELRIHSGLIGDWVSHLQEVGALAGDAPVVGTGAAGSQRFYRDLDSDAGIQLRGAHFTHAPERLAELPRLHAINSVLEVDLLGRANTEVGHRGRLGGIGGLPDFTAAASAADDGLSMVVMAAQTGAGISRIVPELSAAAQSLPPGQIDVLVTEYGSVDLRGMDPDLRAEAIISVAAPGHRTQLRDAWSNE